MSESEQERRVVLAALREEKAGAQQQVVYLRDEIKRLEGDSDYLPQVMMLQKDLDQQERVVEAAEEQIQIRTIPVKRGPGRPRKNPET